MTDLQITKDEVTITLEEALTCEPPSLYVEMECENEYRPIGMQLTEQDALAIICHLIKVFAVPNSNLEVVHFPAGSNRAEALRAAADRLDAGVLDDSTR
jgi:hypothetical protein|tara:strand:- start:11635 stop:11931 length:297 start_codon:yes stop_codon:yes gene_type:complete